MPEPIKRLSLRELEEWKVKAKALDAAIPAMREFATWPQPQRSADAFAVFVSALESAGYKVESEPPEPVPFRWTVNNMLKGDTEPGHFPEDVEPETPEQASFFDAVDALDRERRTLDPDTIARREEACHQLGVRAFPDIAAAYADVDLVTPPCEYLAKAQPGENQ